MLIKMVAGDVRPIGIFDSGAGGLSILREVQKIAPHENLIYFADTDYFPYGRRPLPEIRKRAFAITHRLIASNVKLIVVACNTASAAALEDLRNVFDIPFIGIVPPIKPSVSTSSSKRIVVLATSGTLGGDLYKDVVAENGADTVISKVVSEDLIDMIEQGDIQSPLLPQLVNNILKQDISDGADTVVLGCTHFEFISEVIKNEFLGIDVIGVSEAIARQTRVVLEKENLQKTDSVNGILNVITSSDHEGFMEVMLKLGFRRESYE
tara:strand:- start:114 stop:911 length:798 start_codon:yes stop_codon:yes gene_type:complete